MAESPPKAAGADGPAGEPIAVVGIGCRLPGGAVDASSFWRLLREGTDAIGDMPADRWDHSIFHDPDPSKPRSTPAQQAGFIDDLDRFDAGFFGISPREAAQMDPQHRLLLEVGWEAMEDAGLVLDRLAGSRTGVFMGISTLEYLQLQTVDTAGTHTSTGTASCMAANRLSYAFDLIGPSVSVDTACSSSLVAIHLACTSLRSGESETALAGGVNAIISPDTFVGFSNLSMLSPDSRCMAFDARANGFVRSEGAGIVVLKPLSRARADGDRVHAVILGTASNQDGRSQGLTVPDQGSQERMLEDAYSRAGVEPGRIRYVEAHGTGTQVGDLAEATSLGRVVGRARPADEPLLVGSAKTNIGHLEAAAGIAGVIKACLALKHGELPPNLHFETPNPKIDFDGLNLKVPVDPVPLASEGRTVAGVNSFGFGGTNAHVVLAEAPPPPEPAGSGAAGPPRLLPLSARHPDALRDLALDFRNLLTTDPGDGSGEHAPGLADVCYTAAVRRTHHPFRLVAAGADAGALASALEAWADDREPGSVVAGRAPSTGRPRVAFLFTGQGSQWWGMGRRLLDVEPVFRAAVERCHAVVRSEAGWSLLDELAADEASSRMDRTAFVQPALFALQAGLVELWRSRGVEPDVVAGHSVGEIASAWAAGIMDLEEATRVAVHRGRLMDRASARGRMLAVGADLERVTPFLEGFEDRVSVAAVNSPDALTLSGEPDALEELRRALRGDRVASTWLEVEYAFHSPQMDPIRDELLEALDDLEPRPAGTPIVSTVTGELSEGAEWDADYWWRNLRRTVRFEAAVETLIDEGVDVFLEIGPRPTLIGPVTDCLRHHEAEAAVLSPLRKGGEERQALLEAFGELHTLGVEVDWEAVAPGGRIVPLPSYPWQKERFWSEDERRRREISTPPDHPLLGVPRRSALPLWSGRFDRRDLPYLDDHLLQGRPVFPATGYLEMALAAGRLATDASVVELDGVTFDAPLFLRDDAGPLVETRFDPEEARFRVFSRLERDAPWTEHAAARIVPIEEVDPSPGEPPREVADRLSGTLSGQEIYELFSRAGLDYGPAFRGVRRAWRTDGEALGDVALPPAVETSDDYLVHPSLLDSCFQVILAALPEPRATVPRRGAFLPVSVERLRLHGPPGPRAYSHVRVRDYWDDALEADLRILGREGEVAIEVTGLRCRAVDEHSDAGSPVDDLLYASRWEPRPLPEAGEDGPDESTWLILADRGGLGGLLAERLEARGGRVVLARPEQGGSTNGRRIHAVDPDRPGSMKELIAGVMDDDTPGPLRVLHLWGLDCGAPDCGYTEDEAALDALRRRERRGAGTLLHLLQALGETALPAGSRVRVVTRRAQPVEAGERASVSPDQAELWGLRRVAGFEQPGLRPAAVDLGDPTSEAEVDALLAELAADVPEDEVALRGSTRLVHRYVGTSLSECAPGHERRVSPEDEPFRMTSSRPGALGNLGLASVPLPSVGEGEVRIAVKSTGLNFADVLKALGLYPGATAASVAFGAECAGVVEVVGHPGRGTRFEGSGPPLEPGSRVVALAPDSFGSFVTAPAGYTFPIPEGLSFDQAAGIPIVFLTARYALTELGRLRPAERVLIHSASGGVGLAAIQVARDVGAEIFATAGTPEKREHLRSMGIRHVMDSRTLTFADDVSEITDGEGVDVVLNSLAGEAIPRGLSILRPFGRFIEIGKRDVHANARLGLRPLRDNVTFSVLDLDQAVRLNPALVHRLFRGVMEDFADGTLEPLPVTTFPITEVEDAFRHMSRAEHIGKIAVDNEVEEVPVAFPHRKPEIREDGTYLVTGGVGGFGRTLARWLAEEGAGHLVLASRSAPDSPHAAGAEAELGELGAEVVFSATDAADADGLGSLLERIRNEMPPLRGVVHAAMVLDDGVIAGLDRQRFEAVTRPKVLGAWNLHRQTRDDPLDLFVMTSSISSILGSPGQANYAAANAFLDALAHRRRGLGLPGLSLDVGAVGSVGVVSRSPELQARLTNMGVPPVAPDEVLAALDGLLGGREAQVGVTRLDVSRLAAGMAGGLLPPRFQGLLEGDGAGVRRAEKGRLLAELESAPPEEREPRLLEALVEQFAEILDVPPDDFDPELPLSQLGVDSLMSVELVVWIERELDMRLPTVELMSNPTTAGLTGRLLELLDDRAGDAGGRGARTVDLRADARLDPAIVPQGASVPRGDPDQVFLTGATGFVGAHLLAELLERTPATVHCLVRAPDPGAAAPRVRSALESYRLWREGWDDRIVAVHGDLTEDRFGLSPEAFRELADRVGTIYHAGAVVNFLAPYPALRDANVGGTREVLRLACAGRRKELHHVSSIAVFSPGRYDGEVPEDTVPDEVDGLPDGYSRSKWVAEQLVLEAARQGLDARIYRPGILAGHSETGVLSLDEAVLGISLACCRIGAVPDLPIRFDVVPVDTAVGAMVRIGAGQGVEDRIFHLCSPEPTPVVEIVDWLGALGLELEVLAFGRWRSRMEARAAELDFEPLLELIPESEDRTVERMGGGERRFLTGNTRRALEDTDLELASLGPGLAARYVRYLADRGLLADLKGARVPVGPA